PSATMVTLSGITGLTLSATNSSSDVVTISIGGLSGKAIGAGTYNETDISNYTTAGQYILGLTNAYTAGFGVSYDKSNPLTVVITSIDSKTVHGTFSGNFWAINTGTGQTTSAKKTFSSGEFNLPIQ